MHRSSAVLLGLVEIRAELFQRLNRRRVAVTRRSVDRRPAVVGSLAHVHAHPRKRLDARHVPVPRGGVERRQAVAVHHVQIRRSPSHPGLRNRFQHGGMAAIRRRVRRCG